MTHPFSPRYTQPSCPYDSSRVNFAIHVRLGDRGSERLRATEEWVDLFLICFYFVVNLFLLCFDIERFLPSPSQVPKPSENLMEDVTREIEAEAQPSLLFHVFSETKNGCPSETNGTVAEFPNWMLDPDEVRQEFFLVFGKLRHYLRCYLYLLNLFPPLLTDSRMHSCTRARQLPRERGWRGFLLSRKVGVLRGVIRNSS